MNFRGWMGCGRATGLKNSSCNQCNVYNFYIAELDVHSLVEFYCIRIPIAPLHNEYHLPAPKNVQIPKRSFSLSTSTFISTHPNRFNDLSLVVEDLESDIKTIPTACWGIKRLQMFGFVFLVLTRTLCSGQLQCWESSVRILAVVVHPFINLYHINRPTLQIQI